MLQFPVSCLPSFLPGPELMPPLIPALERKVPPGKELEVRTPTVFSVWTRSVAGGDFSCPAPAVPVPQPLLPRRV